MATKKQPVKKTTTAKSSKKSAKKIDFDPTIIYKERDPEQNKVSPKYSFFYFLFAGTTLLFAAISVWLFIFASELQFKYQSIEACTRSHTRCNVRVDANNNFEVQEDK